MGRFGEADRSVEFAPVADQEDAVAHLRDAVEGGVDQGIARDIAEVGQGLDDLLGDVGVGVVQNVRDVLDQHRKRPQHPDIFEVAQI